MAIGLRRRAWNRLASPDGEVYTSVLDVAKSSEVAPKGNLADTFTLLDGGPVELTGPARAAGPPASGILTSIAEQTVGKLQLLEPYLIPGGIARVLANGAGVAANQQKSSPPLMVRPDGSIDLYEPDGAADPKPKPLRSSARTAFMTTVSLPSMPAAVTRLLPSDPNIDPGLAAAKAILADHSPFLPRPDAGAAGGSWRAITLEEALAQGTSGLFELPVQSWTDAPVSVGNHTLTVLGTSDLGLEPGDWFQPGDAVVLDPGGHDEQRLQITAVNGHQLTFAKPISKPRPEMSDQLGDAIQVLWVKIKKSGSTTGGTTDGSATDRYDGAQAGSDGTQPGAGDAVIQPGGISESVTGPTTGSVPGSSEVDVLGDTRTEQRPVSTAVVSGALARTGTDASGWIPLGLLLILAGILVLRVGTSYPGRLWPGRLGANPRSRR